MLLANCRRGRVSTPAKRPDDGTASHFHAPRIGHHESAPRDEREHGSVGRQYSSDNRVVASLARAFDQAVEQSAPDAASLPGVADGQGQLVLLPTRLVEQAARSHHRPLFVRTMEDDQVQRMLRVEVAHPAQLHRAKDLSRGQSLVSTGRSSNRVPSRPVQASCIELVGAPNQCAGRTIWKFSTSTLQRWRESRSHSSRLF
jgi:hypothetical protein